MPPNEFTAVQHEVLYRISEGDTLSQAAAAAGVHRNTVLNWRRANPPFRETLESIHYERAMHWREQCLPLAPLAINVLQEILENPETKPALRLRVALAIHKIVSTPPTPEKIRERPMDWNSILSLGAHEALKNSPGLEKSLHNDAQSLAAATPSASPAPCAPPPNHASIPALVPKMMHNCAQSSQLNSKTVHNSAQPGRKVGRNEACPCGSGKKFKFCCLHAAMAA